MHEPTMDALEFRRIRDQLSGFTSCQLGRDLALTLSPLPDLAAAREVQQETSEAKAILAAGRAVPFGGIQDIRTPVERALNGGVLTPEQLLAVAETAYGCRQLHRWLGEQAGTAPLVARYAAHFGRFDQLEEEIRRCIERGGVASRASRALREIRGEIDTLQGRIQDRLNGLLRQLRSHLQEALVTTRNGRYVLPVKASARGAVPGTVHGASASGATLFVEPEAIRHLSDELDSWRAMEAAEVEQILLRLSGLVAAQAQELTATLGAVAHLDVVFARARLSQAWGAEPVVWNQEGCIDLKGARHPLLGRSAVGNGIRMSRERRMLIVTGPNTGGKTLLLKTLGLLVILARCGLHIPVEPGSTLAFFDEVFADIGDQQSLEQSLSTFSGHIVNVAPMLTQAGPRTLVLLDELGSGTDPAEGTALGIALLEAFLARGAYTLVTTHLREIKEFGRVTPGCAIAGMGFDGETLRPTYRLVYGTLGESQGLAIAARAGLPPEVVARARQVLNGGTGSAVLPRAGYSTAAAALVRSGPADAAEAPGDGATGSAEAQGENPAGAAHGMNGTPDGPASPTGRDLPEAAAPTLPGPVTLRPADMGFGEGGEGRIGLAGAARPSAGLLVLEQVSPRRCRIWTEEGPREQAIGEGFRREHPEGLVPGDRVRLWNGQVASVLPRTNSLACRDADTFAESTVAANVDHLVILVPARKPDFHAGVLARHLLWAEHHGVRPVICLTKPDLLPKGMAAATLKPYRTVGYQALPLDLRAGDGAEQVAAILGDGFSAVMEVPGAGKGTLLQHWRCVDPAGRKPGEDTEKGGERRWPPQPRLFRLETGAWIADLPGLRELGVWKPDLADGFREFAPYAAACALPGCLHRSGDQGCAVRQAVAEGRLPAERLQQYAMLLSLMGLS